MCDKDVYAVPVTIHATIYVKGDSYEAAYEKAKTLKNTSIEINGNTGREMFCGLAFDNAELPELSLSPAMTIGDLEAVEFVECVTV